MDKSAIIKHENGKYKLYSHKGKVLGTHPSREAAMKQEKAVWANKHGNLNEDIEARANEKIAGALDELLGKGSELLARPAIKGALGLTGMVAPLAMLHAYSNDEDILPNIAGAAKWALPIGALGGAAYGHSNVLLDKILSRIPSKNDVVSGAEELYNKIGPRINELMGSAPKVDLGLGGLSDSIKGLGGEVSSSANDIGSMLRDLSGSIGNTGRDLAGILNR